MSRTLNKVMLIGNVGKSPETKHTPSGIPVTSFRLATTENWKDREGKLQEQTDWHTIVAWRGLAEVIQKLVTKGSRIYIEGRLQTRTFNGKDGNKRHIVEILADNMLLLDSKRRENESSEFSDNAETEIISEVHDSHYIDDDYFFNDEDTNLNNNSNSIPF
ncbi:MAG: single-stranded DNA-binding protein [Candidatus Kapabacteria bacterium]|nr:single-stranded DNA-binding protein [Candidatus Kapabacteria bacterium]